MSGLVRRRAARAVGERALFALIAAGTVAATLAGGCVSDHDALARRDPESGGAGGIGGTGGTGNTGNVGGTSGSGGGNPDDEAPGDDVVTFVNGAVDAPSIRWCFARVDEEGEPRFVDEPAPAGDLDYGRAWVATELAGLDLREDSVLPWVLAGELSLLDGLDCEDAVDLAVREEARVTPDELAGEGGAAGESGSGGVAGAFSAPLEEPRLRARALPILPAGTFATGRSLLFVVTGCLGGAYYGGYDAEEACGLGYEPRAPTLRPLVVKLSRRSEPSLASVQVAHASLATRDMDVRVANVEAMTSIPLVTSLRYGELSPRPPYSGASAADYTGAIHHAQALVGGAVALEQPLPEALEFGNVDAIENGRTYTLVVLGPALEGTGTGRFWQGPVFTWIDNDPTREASQ